MCGGSVAEPAWLIAARRCLGEQSLYDDMSDLEVPEDEEWREYETLGNAPYLVVLNVQSANALVMLWNGLGAENHVKVAAMDAASAVATAWLVLERATSARELEVEGPE